MTKWKWWEWFMTFLTLFGAYVVIFDPWSLPVRLHVYVALPVVVVAFDRGCRAGAGVLLWLKKTPPAAEPRMTK